MTIKENISDLLDKVRNAYVEDQQAKGIRSTGESARTIKKEVKELSGQLSGKKYWYQQKHGRKPGKFPPLEDILDWMRAKKIQPKDNISERSLAFVISRKIAKRGTDIYQGKRPGINIDEKIKKLMSEFTKNFSDEVKKDLTQGVR